MSYFDDESNKMDGQDRNSDSFDGIEALGESGKSREEKALEKAEEKARRAEEKDRAKREKQLEKDRKLREKLEKERDKRLAKGIFAGDIEEKLSKLPPAEKDLSEERNGKAAKDDTTVPEDASAEEKENGDDGSAGKKKKSGQKVDPKEVNIVKDLLSLILYIGIVIVICFLIVTYVGRRTSVHGSSMEPTLQDGDSLWVNMLAYKFGDPERYDIIVFPYKEDVHYIKRIIGLPGETIQITATGDIMIDGKLLKEPHEFSRITRPGIALEPITLGPDEYFVLGDNRNNSKDSRYAEVGNIKRDKIVGKAVFRLTPFKNFGSID